MRKRLKAALQRESTQAALLQGTLDVIVLKILALGPAHGQTIAKIIEKRSEEVLQVEQGSLYPALYRLEDRGWITSFWSTTDSKRKAKFYRLTATGRTQLVVQTSGWDRIARAIGHILHPAEDPE
jgi:transcriptional regulator